MAKARSIYICSKCGRRSPAFFGRCPQCNEFNTMEEHIEQASRRAAKGRPTKSEGMRAPQQLAEIEMSQEPRIALPIEEFSRVLGGGLVPGSLVLLGGEPGIGKSTLVLELSAKLAATSGPVLYVSGEESARQIKLRAERLGLSAPDLYLLTETDLGAIVSQAQALGPTLLVIDSIQTTNDSELNSSPGLVAQVRQCATDFQKLAKGSGLSILLIGHVTKDGNIAGPRVLEHIVDAVLYLEGDPFQQYRLLRGVKNRFGATSEVGVFEMSGSGLAQVPNPSEAFLEERMINASGSAIAITHGRHAPAAGRTSGADQPLGFWQSAAHAQRHRLESAAADQRCLEQARRLEAVGAGYLCQRDWRAAHHGAGIRFGDGAGDRVQLSRPRAAG